MTFWQPIESAPHDGTPILVAVAGGAFHASKAHWNDHWKAWAVTDAPRPNGVICLEMSPTRWMPLPEPPMVGEAEQLGMEGIA